MGALVGGTCAVESDFNRFLLLINMRGLGFLLSVSLLFTVTKADFAAELATFVNETPTGFIVEKMIQNGETCHCRVPDEVEPSSSSLPFVTMPFATAFIGSSASVAADAATTITTTTAGTTTNPTTTAGTTTNPTTTNPTTTNPTTTVPTTTWTTTEGSAAFGSVGRGSTVG